VHVRAGWQAVDPCVPLMAGTEEGGKVDFRGGPKLPAAFVRVSDQAAAAADARAGFWGGAQGAWPHRGWCTGAYASRRAAHTTLRCRRRRVGAVLTPRQYMPFLPMCRLGPASRDAPRGNEETQAARGVRAITQHAAR
jgi:hypothetical protein